MEQKFIANGGLQYVPQIAASKQIIYLDFDGEITDYNGELLTISDVEIQHSMLNAERIEDITAKLNEKYSSLDVIFVTERPENAEYSTIYIGKTSAFDRYGDFAGLAETVDIGNKIKNDNAFVMADPLAANEQIIATISHETDHLLGILDHGGEGLNAYADIVINSWETITNLQTADHVNVYGTAIAPSLLPGGEMHIHAGGNVQNANAQGGWTFVESYTYIYVSNGANIYDSYFDQNAYLKVYDGGTAYNTTLGFRNSARRDHSHMELYDGAVGSNTTLSSFGSLVMYAGSIHRGTLTVDIGTSLTFKEGSVLDLSVYERSVNDDFLVNMLHTRELPTFTITVDPDQDEGTYKLIGAMSRKSINFTLQDHSTVYGKLSFWESLTYNGTEYYLDRNDDDNSSVTLTITKQQSEDPDDSGKEVKVYDHGTLVRQGTVINGEYLLETQNNSMFVYAGGTACETTVRDGGNMYVSSGGSAQFTAVSQGGRAYISCGGSAEVVNVDHGGRLDIYGEEFAPSADYFPEALKGEAADVTIYDGGDAFISGGSVKNLLISSGGHTYVTGKTDVAMIDVTADIYDGEVKSGGVLTVGTSVEFYGYTIFGGTVTIDGWANLSGELTFDLSERNTGDECIVNNIADLYIGDYVNCYITVSADQTCGTYQIAGNAAEFDHTITLGDMDSEYGNLTVNGNTLSYNDNNYKLTLEDDILNLVISSNNQNPDNPNPDYPNPDNPDDPEIFDGDVRIYKNDVLVKQGNYFNGETISDQGNNIMYVTYNGLVENTKFGDNATAYVSSGGRAYDNIIENAFVDVRFDGCLSRTVLYDGEIYAGPSGVMSKTIISGGQNTLWWASSYDTDIYEFSKQILLNGGIAVRTTLHDMASIEAAFGDAVVSSVIANDETSITVELGAKIKDAKICKGANLHLNEALIEGTIQLSGQMFVSDNEYSVGTDNNTIINLRVDERESTDTVMISGLNYLSNVKYNITVAADQQYGVYRIASNASSFNQTISIGTSSLRYGSLSLSTPTVTYHKNTYRLLLDENDNLNLIIGDLYGNQVKVYDHGTLVRQGTVLVEETIRQNYNNSMFVSSGGTACQTYVTDGGNMYVSSGGSAEVINISKNGNVYISGGGYAENVDVRQDATINIFGEEFKASPNASPVPLHGQAKNVTVYEKGYAFVHGGKITDILVSSGGSAYVTGKQNVTAVNVPAAMYGGEIKSGGKLNIGSDVSMHENITFGGSITVNYRANVYGNVTFDLTERNTADSYIVNNIAALYLYNAGKYSVTVNSDQDFGSYKLAGNAAAFNHTISVYDESLFYGNLSVGNSLTVNNKKYTLNVKNSLLTLDISEIPGYNNGKVQVFSSGLLVKQGPTMTGEELIAGQNNSMFIYGGKAYDTTVRNEAVMYVFDGGYAENTIVDKNGTMNVVQAKTKDTTIQNGGFAVVTKHGIMSNTIVTDGTLTAKEFGCVSAADIRDDGVLNINMNGSARYADINKNGFCYVTDAGKIHYTSVNNGGMLTIYENAEADNTTVNKGGRMIINGGYNAASAYSTTVNDGGMLTIYENAELDTITVCSGGKLDIHDNATLSGINTFGGTVTVRNVTDASDATVIFDISERTFSDGVIVNNLANLDARNYSITIADDQTSGRYLLAGRAGNFDDSVTISDSSGYFGLLSVNGSSVKHNDVIYSLSLSSTNLVLTVDASAKPVLYGNSGGITFTNLPGNTHIVDYSQDDFRTVLRVETAGNGVDTYGMPEGTYQYRTFDDQGKCYNGNDIVSLNTAIPQKFVADTDGNTDLFFVNTKRVWEKGYAAMHLGSTNGHNAVRLKVSLTGKNKITDIFEGSADANVLVMTDDYNGDALVMDNIYSAMPNNIIIQQSRIKNIKEIRAGAGDDIIDMTSVRFQYIGNGMTIHGGLGNDTIWANNGENILYGDAGNDNLIGGADNDIIVGGIGNDTMYGGGGNDIFTFCSNFGTDTVEQLSDGKVTLWFANGFINNWDVSTLTYTDGNNKVTVKGVSQNNITLKFGGDISALPDHVFAEVSSEKIFENENSGLLAS